MFDRRSKLLSTVTLLQDLAVTGVAFAVGATCCAVSWCTLSSSAGYLPDIYPFSHYVPLMLAFLLAWAVVGYASRFYRDLEMSNPIQLVLNLLNQLAIVLVIIYAGLYLFRRTDISRTYVLLVGVVDFVLLLVGTLPFVQRHRVDAKAPEALPLLPHRGMRSPCARDGDPHRREPRHGTPAGRLRRPQQRGLQCSATTSAATRSFRPSVLEQVLQDRVIDEVVFAVNMQELARLEPLMAHCANVGVKIRVQLEFLPEAYSRIYLENFHDVPLLSLSSAPESELLLFFKRVFDVVLSRLPRWCCWLLCCCAIAAAIRITFTRRGALPADALWPGWPQIYALQVSLDGEQRRTIARRTSPAQRTRRAGVQDQR